ncbi:MAG: PEP-CTERM sorting domain-containing protein [Methylophilus sp.]
MNFKFKALMTAALLSIAATSANAAIEQNPVGELLGSNSEFFFSAWDDVAGVGYTLDLNWDKYLNDLVGADLTANAVNNTTLLSQATVGASLIGANGVIYDSALTGFNLGASSNVQWNLASYDSSGRNRLLVTRDVTDATVVSNSNLKTGITILNTYSLDNNANVAVGTAGDGAIDTYALSVASDLSAYAGNNGANYTNRLYDTTNALGTSSNLYYLAQTSLSSSLGNTAALQQVLKSYDNRVVTASTYLSSTDNQWHVQLAVAAVPEPETYAMLIAGLGLMGFSARRRSN